MQKVSVASTTRLYAYDSTIYVPPVLTSFWGWARFECRN